MGGEQSCVWDEMNTLTGWTYKNFDCLIRWEGRDYYVQNSIDVTEYRKLTEEAGLDEPDPDEEPPRRKSHDGDGP